jgi:hypothetical protein
MLLPLLLMLFLLLLLSLLELLLQHWLYQGVFFANWWKKSLSLDVSSPRMMSASRCFLSPSSRISVALPRFLSASPRFASAAPRSLSGNADRWFVIVVRGADRWLGGVFVSIRFRILLGTQ